MHEDFCIAAAFADGAGKTRQDLFLIFCREFEFPFKFRIIAGDRRIGIAVCQHDFSRAVLCLFPAPEFFQFPRFKRPVE